MKGMPSGRKDRLEGDQTAHAVGLVVVATSAGGLRALQQLLAALPPDLPVPIVVIQHLDPHSRSLLAPLLDQHTPLAVKEAQDGEALRPGLVYVAPPNHHLLVTSHRTLSLSCRKPVGFLRPRADLLLESAAACYGPGAIAVILTGMGSDGAEGVRAIKREGGKVVAQSEESAAFPGMPRAAIGTGVVDLVLPLPEIGPAVVGLVTRGEPR